MGKRGCEQALRDQSRILQSILDSMGDGVAVIRDITERMEAARRLVRSERLAAIGEMVAGVAHESRNALQQIEACCALLEWKLGGNAEACELVADLRKAEQRLKRLFEELRGYAAPMTLNPYLINLREVVAAAWAALAAPREGRDATLCERVSTQGTQCRADPLRLEQVFRNLMENALAACADPVVIEVEVADAQLGDGPGVCVTFRDNGPGFTLEQRQRAFEPFYTTKVEGTGLGMAIAKRIVEAHQGEIVLGNGPAGGAEIRVLLPRGGP